MNRIFIDCYTFEGEYQGTRTFIKEVYSKIIQIELENNNSSNNHYYFVSNNINELKKDFEENFFIHFVKSRIKNRILRILFEFPILILKYKINIGHFQYVAPPIKFCKYVVTIHDVLFCDYKNYYTNTYRLKNYLSFFISYIIADSVTTVSNHTKENLKKHFYFNKNIIVTKNGVSERFYNYKPLISNIEFYTIHNLRPYILYVSRFEPRKNHINLLKAYVSGKHYKNYDLLLIGSKTLNCKDFDDYHNYLDYEIKKNIRIINYGVNDNLLLEYYYFSSIFVYPSLFEGFGIPPLEALSMGKPVICSNLTAMKDFNFIGKYHIDPTVFNLSLALEKINILDDYSLEKNIVIEEYNWTKTAKTFLKLFSDLY